MQVKITSDGTPQGTKVEDGNGNEVKGLTSVDWHIETGKLAAADLSLSFVALDGMTAEGRFLGPLGKPMRQIVYADGEVTDFEHGFKREPDPLWTARLARQDQRTKIEREVGRVFDLVENLGAHPDLTDAGEHLRMAMQHLGRWHDLGEPGRNEDAKPEWSGSR